MNLTTLKAAAELAKTSPLNRDEWGEDIDPEDVLRLVEVARAAGLVSHRLNTRCPAHLLQDGADGLEKALEGIEP